MNRTKNASRNIIAGLINKAVVLLFPFIIRTIIIKELGSDYLGLNGLFTSVLQVLNLAELGFSSAIVYSMYAPIARKDTETICALMNLYKKTYRVIGVAILLVGLVLIPFLPFLIKGGAPAGIDIYALYIIYLVNTALSYFLFAYKSAIIIAHQRSDITSSIQAITSFAQYIFQMIILILFKNYYIFALVQILTTAMNNIAIAFIAKNRYPSYICHGEISEGAKKDIRKRVAGLMISKICQTTRNSIDSICISTFLGLNIVTIYTNYYSIIYAFIGVMSIISSSIVAGIGNSIVVESEEKNYKDMKKMNFLYMCLSGWLTIFLVCLYQPFMHLWMGKEYMFQFDVVVLLCVYFYALEMGVIRGAYSDAKGLWYENRYRAIAESIANIVLNIVLVQFIGIYGIIIGTLVSLLIINFGYGSQILFRKYFIHQKMSGYFVAHGLYALVTAFICIVTYFICLQIKATGLLELAMRGAVCLIVPAILYMAFYYKTEQFRESKKLVIKMKAAFKR